MWLWGIVIAIALQRLSELVIARRNTARLLAQGGREHAPGHYPLIVVLHAAWLIALVVVVPADATPNFYWLALLVVMQAARLWVLDEPFTSLDDASKQVLRNLIIKHVENAGSVILTTHETVSWQDCKLKRIEL